MSEKIWSDDAWEDYLYWQTQDKKTLKRINQLIRDIERNGCMQGIGKPEPLSGDLQGEYSRRIPVPDTGGDWLRLFISIVASAVDNVEPPCNSSSDMDLHG